ncbi:peptidase M6 immune inhibitor A [Thermaerobacter marianensis DSM 12885]|uniref:Peptidase M6 immune inhibitor A n=1 Tax=Thermaerobacter marianensis (strain ATCC 700841 / DSM 12885 / JCM 10246 / 7p75a) TaxID=644966 RepID=E6SJJ6_THEM7|nr:immune inhibitor A domain-containing protein [Thermaerobacter marianensis]ADU52151.1 peptidase M6 immune inhibitor A [Thermaerobacter marianensis DSM 12885]
MEHRPPRWRYRRWAAVGLAATILATAGIGWAGSPSRALAAGTEGAGNPAGIAVAGTAVAEPQPVDIGPQVRHKVFPVERKGQIVGVEPGGGRGVVTLAASSGYEPVPGTRRTFFTLNYATGRYVATTFTLRGVSEHAEVWVANNLSFPEGDPRNDRVAITDEQVAYLLREFDNNIRPKEEAFFGPWDVHDGSQAYLYDIGVVPRGYYSPADGKARDIILVENVKDENYFDPTYPSYVAGFYTAAYELLMDRNIVTIDAFDWAQRLGPNDAPWRRDPGTGRPYLYEGTLAHEFQHLIHDDYDSDEDNWINEGISDFAEFLVGYGHPDSHVGWYLDHPENSLTAWGDQGDRQILADYGIAYLFQLYLYDHYGGGEVIRRLVANPANGIQGVDAVLAELGYKERFPSIYRDFQVAVMAAGQARAADRYTFKSIDLTRFGSRGGVNLDTPTYGDGEVVGWATDVAATWTRADRPATRVQFNGDDYLPIPWSVVPAPAGGDGDALWSGSGDLLDQWLVVPLDLRGVRGTILSFDHLYDIEEGWDYGFVQVSTDGGKTWTSLANENTRDVIAPEAHPRVRENLPGFTGSSGGWRRETFDLSAYDGREVLLAFRYITDWAVAGNDDDPGNDGWFIDNVIVRAGDRVVAGPFDGSTLDGFLSLSEATGQPVRYLVTVVQLDADGKVQARDFRMRSRPTADDLNALQATLGNGRAERQLVLVTHMSPTDAAIPVHYRLELEFPGKGRGRGR